MYSFIAAILVLILGYVFYSAFVEKVFGIDENRTTPAMEMQDGVDYIPLSWPRIFLIQLLNIAGLGPIFGAIAGALWGPVAFIWIALGGIFAGAVHDYFAGMLSMRHKGYGLPEIVGQYMGKGMKYFVNLFTVVLLILVGTVFMKGPAGLLANLIPGGFTVQTWVIIILVYYFLATILPVDKVIGRIYPFFGAILIFMAVGVIGGIFLQGYQIPEITLANLHPRELPLWPLLFITIACGAISGFHATQSPIMARCVQNEKYGRRTFYGAMIAESVIAMIWAAAAMAFFGSTQALADAGTPANVVYAVSMGLLGTIGGTLAVLGVIILPITSGDTAFRGARYILAEFFNLGQVNIKNRYLIAVPLLGIGFALTFIDFNIVWRYFAWSNQTVATIVLWTASIYLLKNARLYWVTLIPATFMTAVVITYIFQAPEGLSLPTSISYPVGIAAAVVALIAFMWKVKVSGSSKVVPPAGK
jgi:carbon starvation protein CstA